MKNFRYKAYDSAGLVQQGELRAIDQDSAKFKLKEAGLIPVLISDVETSWGPIAERFRIDSKPKIADIEELTSRMALLLKNGIRVDKAIGFAIKGAGNQKLKKTMETILGDIRKGEKLSNAIANYPLLFDELYVGIVRVGEESGRLAQAFSYIAESLAFQKSITAKTRQALLYPLIIFLVCVGSVFFVFNVVIPRFSTIFEGVDNLPAYTRALLVTSDFFVKYQFVILAVVAGSVFGIYCLRDHPSIKNVQQALSAKLPLVKNLSHTLENLRFASALSILLANGVTLSDGLEHAIEAVSNKHIKKRLTSVKSRVRQGESLSETLASVGFLPAAFDGLVEVGEQTGDLKEIFQEMESRLKINYENQVAALITLIEPAMILLMGLIVGSIVVALLLSIVSVNDIVF